MRHVQLTRTNGPDQSLLSTFRRSDSPADGAAAPKSKMIAKRASPDIHAAPLSSEEDDTDSRNEPEPEPEPELPISLPNTDERPKLVPRSRNGAPSSSPSKASSSRQRPRPGKRNGAAAAAASSSPKRTADEAQDEEDTDDGLDLFTSSQSQNQSKRVKSYSARSGRGASTGRREARSHRTPNKQDGAANKRSSSKAAANGWKAPLQEQDVEEQLRKVEARTGAAKGRKSSGSSTDQFKVPMLEHELEEPLRRIEKKRNKSSAKFKTPHMYDEVEKQVEPAQGATWKMPLGVSPAKNGARASTARKDKPRRSTRSGDKASKHADVASNKDGIDRISVPASSSAATTGTEFSVPTILFDLNLSTDESSLSSAVVSPVLEDFDPAKFLEQLSSSSMPPPPSTQTVVCPMCSKPVEDADEIADELPQLDGRRRLTMREQKIFCRAHKMHSARKDWARRGYPDIAWDELPRRIKAYAPALDDIFRGRRPSFFRRRLEHSVKAGGRRNRTAAQAMVLGGLDEASPGYYGPKGARIFEEMILHTFASKLRQQASSDPVMASRGVSSYVQSVLVPELATLLVMDDMLVDDEAAREILRQSVNLGELLSDDY